MGKIAYSQLSIQWWCMSYPDKNRCRQISVNVSTISFHYFVGARTEVTLNEVTDSWWNNGDVFRVHGFRNVFERITQAERKSRDWVKSKTKFL